MMTWKFPGAGGEGNAMDDTLAVTALWDEREAIAKRLYKAAQRKVTPGTFWPWESLNERTRKPWLKKAEEQMK
jgi:N-acetyl-anhydromuramyl-L-alanine amidase AmpD